MRMRKGLFVLLTCLLLTACGGNAEPAATGNDAAAADVTAPVSVLPTAKSAANAAAPAKTAVVSTPSPVASSPVLTPTAASAVKTEATPTFTPLEAEASGNCEIESSLDLVGYPNLEGTMGCATEEAIFDPIAINEFGEAQPTDRFMLWFSHENMIYVLLPDGTYQTHEDTWNEATDPTYPCNPLDGEEDSPPLPRRGFGKLWCSDPELQEVLGTVPREERLCQYSVIQSFQNGRLLACFEDATIRYFRILDDGTWDLRF
jgi:hypothetical protein